MKKLLLLFPVLLVSALTNAQVINAGPDTVTCPGNNIVLSATVSSSSSGNSYTITQIPYVPFSYTTGTMVSLSDDAISGALPIGFTFSFMGNSFTQFYIGSNGWLAFSPQPASFTLLPIPNSSIPMNCIMGAFHDLNPGAGGMIRYSTTGTAPNRKLIVSWSQVPLYSCNTPVTQQIVLYEGTNIIENFFQNKPVCASWSNGNAIQGIQDATGTIAYAVPGRNCTQWTATNEGWRYAPSSASAFGPVTWYNASGAFVGTGNSYAANVTNSTYYVASVYDTATATTYYDTVNIAIGIPGLVVSVTNPSCASSSNGSAAATAPGGPFTYSWSTGATTSSVTGLGTGNYSVTVSSSGCSETVAFSISPLALLNAFATSAGETCIGCNDGIAYSYPSGGAPPYSFMWQPGAVTTQDYYNIAPGTYTVCITDANGCTVCDSVTVDPANVGVEEQQAEIVFSIVPNPVTGNELTLVISSFEKRAGTIIVTDLAGKMIYSEHIAAGGGESIYKLDVSRWSRGAYFVKLQAHGISVTRKLVKAQ